ncbi:carbohydrate ABC transporter permease [Sinomonas terrae]|uniref:Sugar ABC transporter permease n=1 Tax=Sinomonas terrae TaxID=2908838 RepID=A0ABS9U0D2_9MICC|nr:sugar ABC transporter permease [Sinomonas terrae]MCH6470066.1 sugar ABC transporter permease [Sinomonas terrae]
MSALTKPGTAAVAARRARVLENPWLFILPALAVYAAFLVWPAIQSVGISFTNWNGISPVRHFVGLQNYVKLSQDPTALTALKNNGIWSGVTIVVPMVLGLLLAVLLNGSSRLAPLLRTVFYMPAVLPLVSVAAIWGWLYDPNQGSVNAILKLIGLGSLAQPWLGQDSTALWAVIIPGIWVRTGFPMLLYLAALQGIPKELYESAQSDGANRWQRFWYITMPGLRASHLIVFALSTIESFKVFDLVFAMTNGGPGNSTQVLGTWMYFNVFQYLQAGYGTAIAVVITLAALVFGIPYVLSQIRSEKP